MSNTYFDKLKERWGVETTGQILLIFFIFSLTGATALYVRRFMFGLLGIGPDDPVWLKIIAWLFTVFPSYQVLFLVYGSLMGQFEFVWEFEKHTFRRIRGLFKRAS